MARVQFSDGCTKYGAWMGRESFHLDKGKEGGLGCKASLRLIGLDSGGYDSGGAYWGTPNNVYMFYASSPYTVLNSEAGFVCWFLRADSWQDAARKVRERYPNVLFHRKVG